MMDGTVEFYRKKPIVIQSMRLGPDNAKDVCDWINSASKATIPVGYDSTGKVFITTLEGTMYADIGDWVIQGVHGEFYPCKPDIFAATYEPVAPQSGRTDG